MSNFSFFKACEPGSFRSFLATYFLVFSLQLSAFPPERLPSSLWWLGVHMSGEQPYRKPTNPSATTSPSSLLWWRGYMTGQHLGLRQRFGCSASATYPFCFRLFYFRPCRPRQDGVKRLFSGRFNTWWPKASPTISRPVSPPLLSWPYPTPRSSLLWRRTLTMYTRHRHKKLPMCLLMLAVISRAQVHHWGQRSVGGVAGSRRVASPPGGGIPGHSFLE